MDNNNAEQPEQVYFIDLQNGNDGTLSYKPIEGDVIFISSRLQEQPELVEQVIKELNRKKAERVAAGGRMKSFEVSTVLATYPEPNPATYRVIT